MISVRRICFRVPYMPSTLSSQNLLDEEKGGGAAIRAGFSKRTARQQGQRPLTNRDVRKERAADLMGELLFGARNAREIDE